LKKQYRFWLDNKKEDRIIAQVINDLKLNRKFSYAVKIGILIVFDLMHGDSQSLYNEFPWLLQQGNHSYVSHNKSEIEIIESTEEPGQGAKNFLDGMNF